MERLSQSSKRVGPMRGLSPGVRRLIVQLYAEVASMDVCDYLTSVLLCAQESPDEFVETYPFRTGHLDHAVHRRPDCDVGQCGSDVIRHDGLDKGR